MRGGYELLKGPGDQEAPSHPVRTTYTRRVVLGALVTGAILLSALYAYSSKLHPADASCSAPSAPAELLSSESKQPLAQCASSLPRTAKAPAPVNVWASLTLNETVALYDWLDHPLRGLNLTSAGSARLNDNIVVHLEAYRPSKADAVRYLESPSEATLPTRYARVTLQFGARSTEEGGPVIKDYLVGPLPLGPDTSMRELKEIYHRDDIPFNARGFVIPTELTPILTSYMPRLAEVTKVRPHAMHVRLLESEQCSRICLTVLHWASRTIRLLLVQLVLSVLMAHSVARGSPGEGISLDPGFTLSTSSSTLTSLVRTLRNGSCSR